MSNRRQRNVTVEYAISAFHSEIKSGPDFVCTCCHRMMYRKSVVVCNKDKYVKAGNNVLQKVFSADFAYISSDGKEWMCKTCDRALKRGFMSLQAKANGLHLCDVPPALSGLNALELRLICLHVPFMKMHCLFVAQYIVEAKQVLDIFAWRQKPSRQFTASQARDQTVLSQYVRKDKAYSFMKNIRGSPPYYQHTFYDLLAIIRQLGTPTWFFTLSAADLKRPDMIQSIAKQYGVHHSDDEVATLSFDEKSNWLKRNPVTAARHFHYRLSTLFQEFLRSTSKPFGEIIDYAIRIEFQARGSPHAHCVIWVKDAPEYGVDHDSEVCDFIDRYVSCKVPKEDCKLKELVLLLQKHKHSSYCKRNKKCRFHFPKPPSSQTLITKDDTDPDDIEQALAVLSKVQKLIAEGDTIK